jgi:transposase
VFMARTSTPWVLLPAKELGCGSATTCWRRFDEWAKAGVFEQLQALPLDELGGRCCVCSVRGRLKSAVAVWRQIAMASPSNATANRRPAGSSTASS